MACALGPATTTADQHALRAPCCPREPNSPPGRHFIPAPMMSRRAATLTSSLRHRAAAPANAAPVAFFLASLAACGAEERSSSLADGLSGFGDSATAGSDGLSDGTSNDPAGGTSDGPSSDDNGNDDGNDNGGPIADCDAPSSQAIGAGDDAALVEGLSIAGVEANQGVGIALWNEQGSVTAATRPAPLITERPMMVRAIWNTDPAFEAQEVEGRLIIRAGGEEYVFSQSLQIAGDGEWRDNFFSWVVPPCLVTASTEWAVALVDPSGDGAGGTARVPESDAASLDPWSDPMDLNMVFVVVHPTRGEGGEYCTDGVPDAPAADISSRADDLEAYLMSTLPVRNMEVVVTDPVVVDWGADCNDPAASVDYLDVLREQEGRGANWYYQALVPYYPGWSGSAVLGAKVSWSEWWDYLPIHAVHELIHNLGVEHVDSLIDAWGWGPYDGPYPWEGNPRLGELKDPSEIWNIMKTTADTYMWVDTGVYSTTANAIRELNSAADRAEPTGRNLGAGPRDVPRSECRVDKSAIRR